MINFISNLPQDLRTGGFSAMNAAAFSALSGKHNVNYVGPVNPPPYLPQKVLSKSLRIIGSPGNYFFFSQQRLEAIRKEVGARCIDSAHLDFFHGFTPWILTRPQRPYIAWSDCTFHDYMTIFHRRDQFRRDDLNRIEYLEAAWLNRADRVLFTSEWAANNAIDYYGISSKHVGNTGIFGEVDLPLRDAYLGGRQFAFISTNFEAKGGSVVLAAFRKVKMRCVDASLVIVGDQPVDTPIEPGVEYIGYLRKEIPEDYGRFQKILSGARALVNATKSDISPVLLVEAGYFGCPVISSRRFAIPELVKDGITGLLLDDPADVSAVAEAMCWMIENEHAYMEMRRSTWDWARRSHTKPRFAERLLLAVHDLASGEAAPNS